MWAGPTSSGNGSSTHPYATTENGQYATNTSPTSNAHNDNYQTYTPGSGYSVGRGPYRPGTAGHHAQLSGGNPLSLEDLRRRTIKINLGEPGLTTKQMRTIDISECESGVHVLQAALRKFGKGGGLGHGGEPGMEGYGELYGGGLVVDGWGAYLEGPLGDTSGALYFLVIKISTHVCAALR